MLFVLVYVATLLCLLWIGVPFIHGGLVGAIAATIAAVRSVEHGDWNLGLRTAPRIAFRECALGAWWGVALIGTGALAIVLLTDLRHVPGRGFPWLELVVIYMPAVLHEELLFRGYPFQKLHQHGRWLAIVCGALLFAALHGGNAAVTSLGLVNVFLGGILLGLAYDRHRRLWFPIGIHLGWNVMSGPILGHEVSGFASMRTVFAVAGSGPDLLTGGAFGIEGSVVLTAVEIAASALLVVRTRARAASVSF